MTNFNGKTDPLEFLGCDLIVLTPFAQGFTDWVQLALNDNPFNNSDEIHWRVEYTNGQRLGLNVKEQQR